MKIGLEGVPIVVSAPSGAGKTTICKLISKRIENVEYSVSATTRPARKDERDGINYYFLSREQFKDWIENDKLIEWAKVHNHYYGTPKEKFQKTIKTGKNIIMDIDVKGGMNIKKTYPNGIFIFLLTENIKILRKRLRERKTNSKASIEERIKNAEKELESINEYNYVVVNDTIENTLNTITSILIAEGCKTNRNKKIIESFRKKQ
jgi:guanylate kinase